MRQWSRHFLAASALLASFLTLIPAAAADIDLTGRWRFDVSLGGSPLLTTFGDMAQSGTDLTLAFVGDPSHVYAGTIDPGTRAFSLSGGPFTFPDAPPGPEMMFDGTASADGNALSAASNACIYEPGLGWGCIAIDVAGTRSPVTCGDGVVQAGESCDLGAGNGGSCCTLGCGLVDPDADAVCSAIDNCVGVANPDQSDLDDDGVGDACDVGPLQIANARLGVAADGTAAGIIATGTFPGALAVPSDVHVLYFTDAYDLGLGTLPAWAAKECTVRAQRIRCVSPDRTLSLVLSARRAQPGVVRFRVSVKRPPLTPPFGGPVSLTFLQPDGLHVGTLENCTTGARGTVRCR